MSQDHPRMSGDHSGKPGFQVHRPFEQLGKSFIGRGNGPGGGSGGLPLGNASSEPEAQAEARPAQQAACAAASSACASGSDGVKGEDAIPLTVCRLSPRLEQKSCGGSVTMRR
jgi:hypothetical protein